MKSSKKIELLQKDIMNAMNAINEINIERISENKTPSSGMVVFNFESKRIITTFGEMKDFKQCLIDKAKIDNNFRKMLDSVQTNLMLDDLENRCLKVFQMDKPSPKKFPSGGEMNHSKIVFDETTKIPKEFVIKSGERQSRFEEKNPMEAMDENFRVCFNSLNEMFKPKDQK